MNFNSDNVYGVHPKIMDAMVAANASLTDVSYCHDDGAAEGEAGLSKVFERQVKVFFVLNGTVPHSFSL